jgi:hypothetical protein
MSLLATTVLVAIDPDEQLAQGMTGEKKNMTNLTSRLTQMYLFNTIIRFNMLYIARPLRL